MKRNFKSIAGCSISATDGEIGKVTDIYFDDKSWTTRYLVVDTGNWLFGRKVLLSPQSLHAPNWDNNSIPTGLTKDQVKNSPDIDTDQDVTRQQEAKLYEHYPWNHYWGGGLWAGGMGTTDMMTQPPETLEVAKSEQHEPHNDTTGDPHLRSTRHISGYTIKASDGSIGDVEDFIVDDTTWKIQYLVVDTGNWLPGKKVIIDVEMVNKIDWESSSVFINETIEQVKNSPAFDDDKPLNEMYEQSLRNHYNNL